jgi:hypothetical protein
MKELIRRILKEEQDAPVLTKNEIILFKQINNNRQDMGTKEKMVAFIKGLLRYFNISQDKARFYYEVYTANFRPDGDYENLNKENFKDYRQFKQRKVANNSAYEYANAKMPFKGSNVEGQWNVNNNNDWYYVIISWGWYPVFLYINDMWYRTLDTYSPSTRKQMSQVNPVKFDSNLNSDVMVVTKGEMERLMDGRYNLERVNTDRVSNFVGNKDSVTNQSKLISGGWGENAHRVNFMIKDVENVDGKIKILVKVLKAGKMVDRKMIPDSNFRDNPELVDNIMKTIKQDIFRTYQKYLTDDNTVIELTN